MDQFRNSDAGRPRSLSPGGATGGAASDPAATAIGTMAPVGVPRPHKQRPDIKPWILRDPIPQSVKEEVIRKAKAERVAFVQHVVAAPFRMLWRLTRSPQRASDGGNASRLAERDPGPPPRRVGGTRGGGRRRGYRVARIGSITGNPMTCAAPFARARGEAKPIERQRSDHHGYLV